MSVCNLIFVIRHAMSIVSTKIKIIEEHLCLYHIFSHLMNGMIFEGRGGGCNEHKARVLISSTTFLYKSASLQVFFVPMPLVSATEIGELRNIQIVRCITK